MSRIDCYNGGGGGGNGAEHKAPSAGKTDGKLQNQRSAIVEEGCWECSNKE